MTEPYHKECEGCKGCNLGISGFCTIIHIQSTSIAEKCPCANCIVKGMCNQVCPQRITFHCNVAYFELKRELNNDRTLS